MDGKGAQPDPLVCPSGLKEVAFAATTGGRQEWCEHRIWWQLSTVREGTWVEWYPSGKRRIEAHYNSGKLDDARLEWHPNGKKKRAGVYESGKKAGAWYEWSPEGSLIEVACCRYTARAFLF